MKEPLWQRVRSFLANPIPRRRGSSIATWWEWRCRIYRVRPLSDASEQDR